MKVSQLLPGSAQSAVNSARHKKTSGGASDSLVVAQTHALKPASSQALLRGLAAPLRAAARPQGGGLFLFNLIPGLYGIKDCETHPGHEAAVIDMRSALDASVDVRHYFSFTPTSRTVVAFHGNGDSADSMDPAWQCLRQRANVFAVNAPGYGSTEVPDDLRDVELQMMANVKRLILALQLRNVPAAETYWYGYSLGGAQAAMGFSQLPGSHLILENTFTSARNVVGDVLARGLGAKAGHRLSDWLARGNLQAGRSLQGVDGCTDGLDTLGKLERCTDAGFHHRARSRVHVVGGAKDALMPARYVDALQQAYGGPLSSQYVDPEGQHVEGEVSFLRVRDNILEQIR